MKKLIPALTLSMMVLLSFQANAQWQLDNDASSFYYVSSKVSAVSEVNSFTVLAGSVDSEGNVALSIDLASVETAVEVRNERVRDLLFQVSNFPTADVKIKVPADLLAQIESGHPVIDRYPAYVSLHGITEIIDTELQITKLSANAIQVQLTAPLIISANNFGLAEGIEALREIAGLASINPNVVVDFNLVFRQ